MRENEGGGVGGGTGRDKQVYTACAQFYCCHQARCCIITPVGDVFLKSPGTSLDTNCSLCLLQL